MRSGSKMRLMHLVLSLNIGGLEIVVINLLRQMDREIYTPFLCCLKEPGSLVHEVDKLGIKTVVLGKNGGGIDFSVLARLAMILKREGIDIIHSHNPGPHFYAALAGKLAGVSVIIHTKHGRNPFRNWREPFLRKILSCMTDKIVAVSDDANEIAISKEKFSKRRVVTIINGIDIDKYCSNIDVAGKKREIGVSDGDFIIGIVARLASEKDHSMLLDAFRIVLDHANQNVKLVIVGDGALREELERKAHSISIADNVIFLGERRDVPELLATFDLFVLSSVTEGVSMTLLEAMAAELPIVATDVGGNAEVVLDNRTGLIVPPRNPEAMAHAMLRIMGDDDMAKQMGIMGKERVYQKFSSEAMSRKYENIYEYFMRTKGVG